MRPPRPRWLLLPAILGLAGLVLPVVALCTRVDWAAFPATLASQEALDPLVRSLVTALAATVVSVLLGVPLAIVIARAPARTAAWLRALIVVPMLLPPMVGGLALLAVAGRSGLIGAPVLKAFDVAITMTPAAVVIAQVFVAMPLLVLATEQALRAVDPRLEPLAATLGARPATVLRRVTLPLVAPAIGAGAIMTWSRALAEFGATALFAGNVPGVTRTAPLAIYTAYAGTGTDRQSALAIAIMLLVAALGVLLGLRAWRVPDRADIVAEDKLDGLRASPPAVHESGRVRAAASLAPRHDGPSDATVETPGTPGGTVVSVTALSLPRAALTLRAELELASGERLAVVGPNGAGKSTLLDALAGLAASDKGTIHLGDTLVDGPGVHVRPEHRGIGLLRQDALLFPHLDVLENVAFGVRAHGRSPAEAHAAAADALDEVGAANLAARRVEALSGGQRARVAIARAIATRPRLLLLDEPFAALDVESAAEVRRVLVAALDRLGATAVLVTHELADAVHLASRVLVLEAGSVVEDAPLERFLRVPGSAFGASLVGVTRHPATIEDGIATLPCGVRVPARDADGAAVRDGTAITLVEPEAVMLDPPDTPEAVPDRVLGVGGRGRALLVRLASGLDATLSVGATPPAAGTEVTVYVTRAVSLPITRHAVRGMETDQVAGVGSSEPANPAAASEPS